MYDLNNDGNIRVSDASYLNYRRWEIFKTWLGFTNAKLFTITEYNAIKNQTANLKSTYTGTSSITISSPVSGGSASYYLIAPGYSDQVSY